MKLKIKYITGLLAVILLCVSAVSCIKDQQESVNSGKKTDNTVRLEIYTNPDGYTLPGSRANENSFDREPMIIVFQGHGNSALFFEASKAVFDGTFSIVNLTVTDSPVTLVIITNAPEGSFFNGTTTVPFTADNINDALKNKTLGQLDELNLLRTVGLGPPILPTLPFFEQTAAIPMSAIYELSSVNSDQTIGSPGNYVQLIRSMAKVTVEVDPAINSIFELKSVGVVNAPASGSFYYDVNSPVDNTGNLLRYGDNGGGMAQAVKNSYGIFTTELQPIYLYESRSDQGTAMIIKAEVEGAIKYFNLPFYNRKYMDILRNKHYIFRIISAGNGFDNIEDAINSNGSPNFKYQVTVTDTDSYDVVSNEKFYIGVTSSAIESFVQTTHTADISVFTDAKVTSGLNTSVTADAGITVSPASLNFATTTVTPGSTDLNITIDGSVKEGRVILRVGTLTKVITVKRHEASMQAGVALQLPYNDYVWGQSQTPGWLFVSSDGVNPVGELEKDAPGKMYLMANPIASGIQTGHILAVRGGSGRSSIYVTRPVN